MKRLTSVLLVGDDPSIVRIFSEMLRDEGYQVWNASTGEQALEAVHQSQPGLVLLDVNLPDSSGLEVCRRIKADPNLADVFVVLISDQAINLTGTVGGLCTGADDYITRQLPTEQSMAHIQTLARLSETTALLRASEEQFRKMVENVREVFWLVDAADNRMIYISPAYEKIWDRKCDSPVEFPRDWLEAVHPEDRERVTVAALTKGVSGEYDETYRIVRPDGTVRWIHERAIPIRDPTGKVYRLAGTAEDITEHYQSQQALKQAEAHYRGLFEHATEGIFRSTPEGRLLDANPALLKMFGYNSLEEALANITDVAKQIYVKPERRAELQKALHSRGYVEGFEVENKRKDGTVFWVNINAHVIRDSSGAIVCYEGSYQDISERKRFEEELRRFPRRILEAQEIERQRVARDLHDSVNQLVASALMRLRRVAEKEAHIRPSHREILSRCHELLEQALEENRRIAHNLRPSELDELGFTIACRHLCRHFSSLTNIPVSCRIGRLGRRLAPAAELHLFRIVQEALNNIRQHARAKRVRVRLGSRDGVLRLSIQDDGRGFTLNRLKLVKRKQHGIGLSNIHERAAALGGRCEILSRPGEGTTITILLVNAPGN